MHICFVRLLEMFLGDSLLPLNNSNFMHTLPFIWSNLIQFSYIVKKYFFIRRISFSDYISRRWYFLVVVSSGMFLNGFFTFKTSSYMIHLVLVRSGLRAVARVGVPKDGFCEIFNH